MAMSDSTFEGKTVLVTGGAGLIGSAFVAALLDRGARVRTVRRTRAVPQADRLEVLEGDLRDLALARQACRDVHALVHAAGVSGGSKQVSRDPIPMFTDSLWMNTVVLEAARLERVGRFLFISNSSVYPASARPLREDQAWDGPPENETGEVKRAGEAQCAVYGRSTSMTLSIIRSGNAYGPWDNFDLESSHVAPAIIRKAVESPSPIVLWGDGAPTRDFIHTSDIAAGGLHLLARGVTQPVNVATGQVVSIAQLARAVMVAAGRSADDVRFSGESPPASPAKLLDLTRMRGLGFAPRLSLEEGLGQTIAWYRAQAGGGA
jgi:GDP-L-fucose synthase